MRAAALVLVCAAPLGAAQSVDLGALPVKVKQYVAYDSEQQVIAAGKRSVLELHFRVLPGYHVNSHLPKSELLLPTKVQLGAETGVKLAEAEYPAGSSFSFALDPGEKLDVYAGDFVVRLPVIASSGEHELKGALVYQACNNAACYPPKTLPVDVVFTAK